VSAGDAGANNFAGFRQYVVAQTRTRLYAFVHIANMGLTPYPVAEALSRTLTPMAMSEFSATALAHASTTA